MYIHSALYSELFIRISVVWFASHCARIEFVDTSAMSVACAQDG